MAEPIAENTDPIMLQLVIGFEVLVGILDLGLYVSGELTSKSTLCFIPQSQSASTLNR
ncbi:hypothetical protein HYDPIDRAFT_114599 [Hydnomerulius pinastri MD-312]|uniref:Uncharacterized protein n=1 Tax=Hydnomerulius pinastri MD-312 TaxID=994086 RepID=A0A0C9V9V6_9AGAM|nr:hypothetical protein HYDPIDRAFT_114599 [Hydnomerulius pinastri MD-312]